MKVVPFSTLAAATLSICCIAPLLHGQGGGPKIEAVGRDLPLEGGAQLEKDFKLKQRDWAERHLLQKIAPNWTGKTWEKDAVEFCSQALDVYYLGEDEGFVNAPLIATAKKLVNEQVDDPMVRWLYCFILMTSGDPMDYRLSGFPFQKARETADDPSIPAALGIEVNLLMFNKAKFYKTDAKQIATLLGRSLADGSYDEDDGQVMVRQHGGLIRKLRLKEQELALEDLERRYTNCKAPSWAKDYLAALAQIELGWVKRGTGYINTVTEDGYKAFRQHIDKARDYLTQSWKAKPGSPEAAATMITVEMAAEKDITVLREWFDRSISGQLDYMPAYNNLLWALRPRWGGSYDQMATFGKACARTARFDTEVPAFLWESISDIVGEVGNASRVFQHKDFRDAIAEVNHGYLAEEGPSEISHQRRASQVAVAAYLIHDRETTAKALEVVGAKLHPAGTQFLKDVSCHEAELRLETLQGLGHDGPEMQELDDLMGKQDFKGFMTKLEELDPDSLPDAAAGRLRALRSLTGITKQMAKGDPVPLVFGQGLTTFEVSGDWAAVAENHVELKGGDVINGRVVMRAPVTKDLVLQGEFTLERGKWAEVSPLTIGLSVGGSAANNLNLSAWVRMNDQSESDGSAYIARPYGPAIGKALSVRLKEVNTFRLATFGDRVSFTINGIAIVASGDWKKGGLRHGPGLIGLHCHGLPPASKCSFKNVEVRVAKESDLEVP